jgi:thiamine-phosphate pyrophosphorylase
MTLQLPRVYPILDTESLDAHGLRLEAAAAAVLEGGAGILQLRHKGHWSRAIFQAAQEAARLAREAGAMLIVNDRADFAMLLDAGLHIGQDDLSPRDARRLLGTTPVLGLSSHSLPQLTAAGGEPVDYVALGPIFGTRTKRNPDPVVGIVELNRCRAMLAKPLVAIGGITLENAAEVWAAGADSVAIIGSLLPAPFTALAVRQRMEEWQRLSASLLPPRAGTR